MGKSENLVSLISGCYNGSKFIERCFDSVLSQTYRPLEFIFVNDGSTDNSKEIAESYQSVFKQKDINYVIVNQENMGYYPTSGIKIANGDFICTLDIDDVLLPYSIEKRADFLVNNKDFVAVRTNGYIVPEDNLEDKTTLFVVDTEEKINEDIFLDLLYGKTNNWAGSYMVKSSELFKAYPDKYVPMNRYGQNLQILMPVVYQNKTGFIDEPLMKYIRHNESFTTSDNSYKNKIKQAEEFKIIRQNLLNKLHIKDLQISQKLEDTYNEFFSRIAYRFAQKNEFNEYYRQIKHKKMEDKIRYFSINENKNMLVFYSFLQKFVNKLKIILAK